MLRWTGLAVLGICLLALSPAVNADTIYNNFGPGDTYNSGAYHDVFGAGILGGMGQHIANPFTPGNSYTLDSITLAMSLLQGASDFTVDVRSDNGGVPGSIIEFWHFLNVFTGTPSVRSMNSVLHPTLDAGSLYWFEVRATNPTAEAAWWTTSPPDVGPWVFSQDDGATWKSVNGPRSVFRVEGTPVAPVPEPGTLALLGSGLTLLVGFARRLW